MTEKKSTEETNPEKSRADKGGPVPKFTANIYVHVKDTSTNQGIVGAMVDPDPRSGGSTDPSASATVGVGSGPPHSDAIAQFLGLSTNGPEIYDIQVTCSGYQTGNGQVRCTSTGDYHEDIDLTPL